MRAGDCAANSSSKENCHCYRFRRYDHLRWGGLPVGRLSLCNLNEGCAEKAPILLHRRRTMNYSAYVGLDVHKTTIAIAVAEAGRGSEVRFFGEIANSPDALATLLKKLGARHGKLYFVHEAGPCGYGLYRQIIDAGHVCDVVSPAHTPRRAGDRIKTDRRDAIMLARLSRAGELTKVWTPDYAHEAMRDLIRSREVASKDVRQARQRVQGFLLRNGRRYAGAVWKRSHRVWLGNQTFDHPAQQIAFQTHLNAMDQAVERKLEIEKQIQALLPDWSLGPVVEALQALRGVALAVAAGVVAEVGDFQRFDNPRQLMAYLGLVPGERSSGETRRPTSITKAGSIVARKLIVEAAWAYRMPAKIGQAMQRRQEGATAEVRAIAWKAQVRLCARYRRMLARRKTPPVVITAIARELVGFIWAIGRSVKPRMIAA
jgi:transposase